MEITTTQIQIALAILTPILGFCGALVGVIIGPWMNHKLRKKYLKVETTLNKKIKFYEDYLSKMYLLGETHFDIYLKIILINQKIRNKLEDTEDMIQIKNLAEESDILLKKSDLALVMGSVYFESEKIEDARKNLLNEFIRGHQKLLGILSYFQKKIAVPEKDLEEFKGINTEFNKKLTIMSKLIKEDLNI